MPQKNFKRQKCFWIFEFSTFLKIFQSESTGLSGQHRNSWTRTATGNDRLMLGPASPDDFRLKNLQKSWKFENPKSFLSFENFMRHYYDNNDDSDPFLYSNAIGFFTEMKKRWSTRLYLSFFLRKLEPAQQILTIYDIAATFFAIKKSLTEKVAKSTHKVI